jgi:hypothetical protein
MVITGSGPEDWRVQKVVTPKYNEWREKTLKLRKNNAYNVTLIHTGSRPQDNPPWYESP